MWERAGEDCWKYIEISHSFEGVEEPSVYFPVKRPNWKMCGGMFSNFVRNDHKEGD